MVAGGDGEYRNLGAEERPAELLDYSLDFDLALLRVVGDFGQPALEIGDSSDLQLEDRLRVYGYPEAGGETSITVTEGVHSGLRGGSSRPPR